MNLRLMLTTILLLITMAVTFGLPKPKYESLDILNRLDVPETLPDWKSVDMSKQINVLQDDRYKFISDIFARIYGNREGNSLLLIVLDAGNFHHPKVCFGSSGFSLKELPDTEFSLSTRRFKAKTLLVKKGAQKFIIIYWICINKKLVDWTEQKLQQLWFSLWNKKKTGLMLRMDIPVVEDRREEAIKTAQQFIHDLEGSLSQEQIEYILGK